MKIIKLKKPENDYSSNVYYILGDWNTLEDVNTLIDVGVNDFIIKEMEEINHGVGKHKVEQIILTHDHFDHSAGLKYIVKKYNPNVVYAFSDRIPNSIKITDGMQIRIGEADAFIYYSPGHSNDSISVFIPKVKALFSGDTLIAINNPNGSYTRAYYETIKKYISLNPAIIYPGHGEPIAQNVGQILKYTRQNIEKSKIID
jgi:glyoxylase-like metal-dependent hydrolase (beta-lactamase superfamily II)